MKLAAIALTRGGCRLGLALARGLARTGGKVGAVDLIVPQKFYGEIMAEISAGGGFLSGNPLHPAGFRLLSFDMSLGAAMGLMFGAYDAFIMIMAAGIVVRVIAPLLRGKGSDPAVVVMDEKGDYAVSLLSGHAGGANELAVLAAGVTGGQAVVTTATDVRKTLAADLLANKWGMACDPPGAVKAVNAALVNGEKVVFFVEKPCWTVTECPENVVFYPLNGCGEAEAFTPPPAAAVFVTSKIIRPPFSKSVACLFLRPKNLVAGVGCKKDVSADEVAGAVVRVLHAAGLSPAALKALASVDAKRREEGLLAAAKVLGVKAIFYSPEELAACGENFSHSNFVKEKVGVGAVCEPAAWLAAGKPGRLLVPKTVCGRVTVAVAEESCG